MRLQRLLLCLAMPGTLIACGSDDPDADEPAATTAAADPGPVGTIPPTTAPATTGTQPATASTVTERAGDHGDVAEVDEALARLLVTDATSSAALLIDLDAAGQRRELTLPSAATMSSATTEDGRFALLAHDAAVTVLDGGAWSEAHGDHAHHFATEPVVVGTVEGERPTHLISHDGHSALWFDGSGSATVLDEEELAAGNLQEAADVTSSMPHHGFAIVGEDAVVTTRAETEGEMPNVVVVDRDGETTEHECPEVHGEAAWDGGVAAACGNGVLLVDDTTWESTLVPYPATDDTDPYGAATPRAWDLTATPDGELLVGVLGARHLLLVKTAAARAEVIDVATPVALLGVTVDEATGEVVALTTDGRLQRVDPATGEASDAIEVTAPFVEGEDEDEPYRQVVVHDGTAYVTDPAAESVHAVSPANGEVTTLDIGFAPSFVGVLGA